MPTRHGVMSTTKQIFRKLGETWKPYETLLLHGLYTCPSTKRKDFGKRPNSMHELKTSRSGPWTRHTWEHALHSSRRTRDARAQVEPVCGPDPLGIGTHHVRRAVGRLRGSHLLAWLRPPGSLHPRALTAPRPTRAAAEGQHHDPLSPVLSPSEVRHSELDAHPRPAR